MRCNWWRYHGCEWNRLLVITFETKVPSCANFFYCYLATKPTRFKSDASSNLYYYFMLLKCPKFTSIYIQCDFIIISTVTKSKRSLVVFAAARWIFMILISFLSSKIRESLRFSRVQWSRTIITSNAMVLFSGGCSCKVSGFCRSFEKLISNKLFRFELFRPKPTWNVYRKP